MIDYSSWGKVVLGAMVAINGVIQYFNHKNVMASQTETKAVVVQIEQATDGRLTALMTEVEGLKKIIADNLQAKHDVKLDEVADSVKKLAEQASMRRSTDKPAL
jgi:hypothetical protein